MEIPFGLLQGMGLQDPQQAQALMGLLAQGQGQQPPQMMNAPPINLGGQQPQGDLPAPGAMNAGPAPMPPDAQAPGQVLGSVNVGPGATPGSIKWGPTPGMPTPDSGVPMPPPRPPDIGNPMALQGAQPPTPEGQPMPGPAQPTGGLLAGPLPAAQAPAAGPAAPAGPQGGGFLDGIGKLAKGIGSIYGQGGPGDGLINLGLALSQGGLDRMGNIAKAQEMTQRGQLMQHTMAMDTQKQSGQNQTAQYLAKARGIPYEQALGLVQSGAANALISASVKSPQLTDVRNADGSVSKQWLAPGETAGATVGTPTPAEKFTDVTDPAQRASLGVPKDYTGVVQKGADGKVYMPGKASTEVNIGGGTPKQVFDTVSTRADEARAAANSLPAFQEAQRLITSGQITLGAGADTRVAMQKIGALMGLDSTAASNAETFRSTLAPAVLATVKGLGAGSGISNADREFAEKAAGGNINLEPKTIARLIDIGQRAAQAKVDQHNALVDKIYPESTENGQSRALFKVEVPAYTPPAQQPQQMQGGAPAAPAPAPSPGGQSPGAPVRVQTPDEARRLPKGTQFIAPDGRHLIVP